MEIINFLTIDEKLRIIQDTTKNSFTFDCYLLTDFVNINKKCKRVVDFCTGNAPIAMLLTRKSSNISIDAIELQSDVYNLGKKSIELNNLEGIINIHNDDVINISSKLNKNSYQLITCNPPYFKIGPDSNINPNESVAIARHELKIKFEEIVIEAKKLLDSNGIFCFVHRPQRLDELVITLNNHGFFIKRLKFVHSYLNSDANIVLIEAKKGQKNQSMIVEKPIIVYESINKYTKEVSEILKQ